jgi:exosome complex exonuclease DIS3/RRP44
VDGFPLNYESTDSKILEVVKSLDLSIELSDIDRSHRIGKKTNGKPRDIIVKFSTYRARNAVYRARVGLKTRGLSGVFVNEDLTRMRAALFYKARQLAKEQCILSAWTYDGTVIVKDRNNKIHRILCENDLMSVKSS